MEKRKSNDLPEYMNFKQAMKYLGIGRKGKKILNIKF